MLCGSPFSRKGSSFAATRNKGKRTRFREISIGYGRVIVRGAEAGLRLHKFKRTHEMLPRVRRVLGFLRGIAPESLLDAGSGRGAFLWQCLNTFPELPVTACEIDPVRIRVYEAVQQGGIDRLHFEAIRSGLRSAARDLVVSVPSKEEDNPARTHFLAGQKPETLFREAGCRRIRFDGVPRHLIALVTG